MEIEVALFLYLLIVIAVYLLARFCYITVVSSLALAAIVGLVLLGLLYPYPHAGKHIWPNMAYKPNLSVAICIYALIQLFTWIFILWYIFDRSITDTVK